MSGAGLTYWYWVWVLGLTIDLVDHDPAPGQIMYRMQHILIPQLITYGHLTKDLSSSIFGALGVSDLSLFDMVAVLIKSGSPTSRVWTWTVQNRGKECTSLITRYRCPNPNLILVCVGAQFASGTASGTRSGPVPCLVPHSMQCWVRVRVQLPN